MADPEDPMARFEDALRELAARPPAVTPAAAARALAERIERRERPAPRFRPAWSWTAASLLVAAGIAALLRVGGAPPAPVAVGGELGAARLSAGAGALAEGQVLIWLDAETPLYMNFAPPAGARNDGGGT